MRFALVAVVAHERRKHLGDRRHQALRHRVRCAPVADHQRVDVQHLLVLPGHLSHVVVAPGLDLADACEGQPSRERRRIGNAKDLQLAPAHGVDDELRILVDHHRAQVQLTALEHVELSVDRLRRDLELEFGERSEHAAGEVLGAAAEWPDAKPQASRVL